MSFFPFKHLIRCFITFQNSWKSVDLTPNININQNTYTYVFLIEKPYVTLWLLQGVTFLCLIIIRSFSLLLSGRHRMPAIVFCLLFFLSPFIMCCLQRTLIEQPLTSCPRQRGKGDTHVHTHICLCMHTNTLWPSWILGALDMTSWFVGFGATGCGQVSVTKWDKKFMTGGLMREDV